MLTLRFASPDIASSWPAAIAGPLDWRATEGGHEAVVELPPLAPGDLVVPSVAVLDGEHSSDVSLVHEGAAWGLATMEAVAAMETSRPVIASAAATPASHHPRIATHIDYFSVHEHVEGARLHYFVGTARQPLSYLVSTSIRAERLTPRRGKRVTPRLAVPALSQMMAPRHVRRRICSPTCVAMVLAAMGRAAPLAEVVAECLHPASGMYGVWPLAVRAAARRGVVACVEAIDDLDAVAPFIQRGAPVVASIRFERGALPGAPLPRTDGHLVVVTGLDETHVHVNDPASLRVEDVPRSYDRVAFTAAWLEARGAAYLFGAVA